MDTRIDPGLTRRRFLRTGAVGLAGLSLPACSRTSCPSTAARSRRQGPAASPATRPGTQPAPTRATGPYGPFEMGVQSYCFRKFSLERAVELTRELGLHYIEFFPGHLPSNLAQPRIDAIKATLAAARIAPTAWGVWRFTADHETNRSVFAFCKTMGTRVITADPDPASFASLDKLVAEFDIRVAIHNHGPRHRYGTVDAIARAVADHDERIGACIDTGHLLRAGGDPAKAIGRLNRRLHAVHLKDIDHKDRDVVFGTGRLDLRATLAALRQIHFVGPLSMEYESNPDDPLADMKRCLEAVRQTLAGLG